MTANEMCNDSQIRHQYLTEVNLLQIGKVEQKIKIERVILKFLNKFSY